jgi:hypothetical protein
MNEWTPFFEAANTILDQLPEDLHHLARPDGYDSFTSAQRQQLTERLQTIELTHAQAMNTVRNRPEIPNIVG